MERIFRYILPVSVWSRIDNNPELKKILANINWLLVDRAVQILLAFFVGVWVIRYLGPAIYGSLSFAVASVTIFGTLAKLGLESIVVRELINNPERESHILGTAFGLRVAGGVLTLILSLGTVFMSFPGDSEMLLVSLILAFSVIFQSGEVMDYWFQSKVRSKYVAWARSGALLISAGIKVGLIMSRASLIYFSLAISFEAFLAMLFLAGAYLRNQQSLKKWRFSFELGKRMLRDSWPLILSGMAIGIYARIDQLMIGKMIDPEMLGIYSAAVNVAEAWYLVPAIVIGSVFPAILYAKREGSGLYAGRLQKLYDAMTWSSIMFALGVTLFSGKIVNILYGDSYAQAADVLSVLVWAGVFVAQGGASGRFLIAENLTRISFYRTALGAGMNLLLNLMLIPKYGIMGSAVATLISYGVAVFSASLFVRSRSIAPMLLKSFNIFRIGKYIINIASLEK